MKLNPEDIKIYSYDSRENYSGDVGFHMPGGVHIIHIPTGLEVKEDSERSQHKSKDVAIKKLEELLCLNHTDCTES